jgi:hypothetical protein
VAYVRSKPSTPSDLTDINNLYPDTAALQPGKLTCTSWPIAHTYDAVILGNSLKVTGNDVYYLENQFFEVTNKADASDKPYYYVHVLPQGVNHVTVFAEADPSTEISDYTVEKSAVYHSLKPDVYWVRYYDGKTLRTEMLKFTPVMTQGTQQAAGNTYLFAHGVINLPDKGTYYFRFTADNGYKILPPYNVLANEPWYVRIRSNIRPVAPEYGRQLFMPFRPWMLATWVPGKVLSKDLVEFERRPILFDGKRYPDVLVYDKDYNFKYALDGTPTDSPNKKGFLYPWRRGQVKELDTHAGRLRLSVPLEPDDLCFGFYYYNEPDILYTDLDVNPFTNPAVKDRVIEIIYLPNAINPFQNLYHRVLDESGAAIPELSNEPDADGAVVIGSLLVGGSVGLNEFTTDDTRTPGGGLAKEFQKIPEARGFWDLGFWDGQPFPVGGASVVYLPKEILKPAGQFSKEEVTQLVKSIMPMGTIPVIRYYDVNGEEEP